MLLYVQRLPVATSFQPQAELIDGCVVNEPFAAAVMAGMPASRWSVWFIGCAGLNNG